MSKPSQAAIDTAIGFYGLNPGKEQEREQLAALLDAFAAQQVAAERERLFEVRKNTECNHGEHTVTYWLNLTESAFEEMGPFNTEADAIRARGGAR